MPENQSGPVPTPAVLISLTVSTARSMKPLPAGSTTNTKRSADVNKKYGRAWKRIRDHYAAVHPLCEMCLKEGRLTPVEEVHHIVPISQGWHSCQGQLDEPLPLLPYQDPPRPWRPVGRSKISAGPV